METEKKEDVRMIISHESIKLAKSVKGIYTWEIKIFPKDTDEFDVDKEILERLEKLNDEMVERFGDE